MSRRRVVTGEALAYLRSGLLASSGARVRRNQTCHADLGVLFVHGLAANASQFRAVRRALSDHVGWFDAFSYSSLVPLPKLARRLHDHIVHTGARCGRLVVIGHSLGGLLLRMALSQDAGLDHVVAFVPICAPLHGTHVSRFAPTPMLRGLRPERPLFTELAGQHDQLSRFAVLSIGARRDQFVSPWDSAILDGHPSLVLPDAGHVASLFDARVHDAVLKLIIGLGPTSQPGSILL